MDCVVFIIVEGILILTFFESTGFGGTQRSDKRMSCQPILGFIQPIYFKRITTQIISTPDRWNTELRFARLPSVDNPYTLALSEILMNSREIDKCLIMKELTIIIGKSNRL